MSAPVRFAAPHDGRLDAAMLAAYERDGFLVLDGFLGLEDCDALKQRAGELIAAFTPAPARTVFSTITQAHAREDYFLGSAEGMGFFFEEEADERPIELALNKIGHALHDCDPVFARISRRPRLSAVVASLGLAEPLLLQSMYILKPPQIGGAVDWHQDATFLYTEPSSVVGLWIAVDAATTDNGCLVAHAGSHRGPLRRRFRRRGDALEMEELDSTPLPAEPPAVLEVERGALIVLHGTLAHASAANRSVATRHAFSLHVIDGAARYAPDNWLQRRHLPLRGFT